MACPVIVVALVIWLYYRNKYKHFSAKLKYSFDSQISDALHEIEREKLNFLQAKKDAEKMDANQSLKAENEDAKLKLKADLLTERERRINDQVRERTVQTILDVSTRSYLSETPTFSTIHASQNFDDMRPRILSSLTQNLTVSSPFNISANIIGSKGDVYKTSLFSCTCKDFQLHQHPCKHMYRLAAEVGFLIGFDSSSLAADARSLLSQAEKTAKTLPELSTQKASIDHILSESSQSYPWLSKLYADCADILDGKVEQQLRQKKPPAKIAADNIRTIRNEKVALAQQCKMNEYQLHFYESLFPWLLDFKEIPPIAAYEFNFASISNADSVENYSSYRQWLSPEEYQKLPDVQKFQLALDRYQRCEKSNWEIGIQYERYIGYLCEKEGYSVLYNGATQKLEDMGRDLLLTRDNVLVAIQCKRWSSTKTIHENHVFQLCGTTFELQAHHPDKTVIAAFVTSTIFSDIAALCAQRLDIRLFPSTPYRDYPMIKCNISSSGEKIYHLPFDQQYDRIQLSGKVGCFYCATTAEAEAAGFRRAYRWHGSQEKQIAP